MADCSRKRKASGVQKTNLYALRDNLWNINFIKKEVQEFCTSFFKMDIKFVAVLISW